MNSLRKFRFYFFRRVTQTGQFVQFLAVCTECMAVSYADSADDFYKSLTGHECMGHVIPLSPDPTLADLMAEEEARRAV